MRAFGNLADIRGRPVIDRGHGVRDGLGRPDRRASTCAAANAEWERSIGGNQTPWSPAASSSSSAATPMSWRSTATTARSSG